MSMRTMTEWQTGMTDSPSGSTRVLVSPLSAAAADVDADAVIPAVTDAVAAAGVIPDLQD